MIFSQNGIHLGEKDLFLEWGKPVENLASKYGAIVEKQGENYFAFWGENAFIKESGINLGTQFGVGTLFTELEYSVLGENTATRNFETIKKYFTEKLGQPRTDNQNGERIIWITDLVKIKLELEDFRGLRLHLLIRKNNGCQQTL